MSLNYKILITALVLTAGMFFIPGCESTGSNQRIYTAEELGQPTPNPELARSLNDQAVEAYQAGEVDKAESLLNESIQTDLTFGPAHNNLGRIHYDRSAYYKAATQFEYAAKLMPYAPEPKNNLGLVFERVGKLSEAVESFGEALELQPEHPVLLGNWLRAKIRNGNDVAELKESLEKLAFIDDRIEWRQWATQQLTTLPPQ